MDNVQGGEQEALDSVWGKRKIVAGNGVMQKAVPELCSLSVVSPVNMNPAFPHPLIKLCLCFFTAHGVLLTILK